MIDPDTFRRTLARFATGVTVVTAADAHGAHGMTVTAFSSLSLEPPLVLVCIDHDARMLPLLKSATHFGVNVLAASQEPLARRFSDPERDGLDGVPYHAGSRGVPLLEEALAQLECRRADTCPGGDHTIISGLVESASFHNGPPLLYFRGAYRGLDG